jgi:serine/threonine-protein kinase
MTCPNGHRWQPDLSTTLPPACPVCGAAGQNATVLALCDTISPPLPSANFADSTAAAAPWHIGARLGDYELLEMIGSSGMSRIYRARSVRGDRVAALKLILDMEPGGAALERFRKEAETIARLLHPNIVQVYEVGQQESQVFQALEYCAGGTLADKLRRGPLSPKEAAETVETLAQAMHAVHQHGILHRDLKPSNVLLTVEGQLKITDFGLANTFVEAALTQTGTIVGTPAYMAPEMASGKHHLTGPGTDIYSLGVILYECLTGLCPIAASTPLEMIRLVISSEPVPPSRLRPGIPPDLEAICLKCLRKEPRQRYATVGDLAADLRRWLPCGEMAC